MKKVLLIVMFVLLAATAVFAQRPSTNGRGPAYKVGDTGPGGGVIFYHDPEGFTVQGYGKRGDEGYFASYTAFYLEAAPLKTAATAQWGNQGNVVSEVTTFTGGGDPKAGVIGNGRKDTQIVAAHMKGRGITDSAAQKCAELTEGGLNDWFLPSPGELLELFKQAGLKGVELKNEALWSSSQSTGQQAASVRPGSGAAGQVYADNKENRKTVRAMRAF
ncbi:MAG: hypothetical protein LBU85_01365 [Treponema sp.]|nr:hypothetical protein [Treponema sp.]